MSETRDDDRVHRIRNVVQWGRRDSRAASVVLLQIVKILEEDTAHFPGCNSRCDGNNHWLSAPSGAVEAPSGDEQAEEAPGAVQGAGSASGAREGGKA